MVQRYSERFMTWKHKKDSEKDVHAQIQSFSSNYLFEKRKECNLEKTLFIDYEREFDSVKKDRFYLVF